MECVRSIEEVIQRIEQHNGKPEEFELPIPLDLLDQTGVAMAVITDRVLARGWMPNGYQEEDGTRIFRYTEL